MSSKYQSDYQSVLTDGMHGKKVETVIPLGVGKFHLLVQTFRDSHGLISTRASAQKLMNSGWWDYRPYTDFHAPRLATSTAKRATEKALWSCHDLAMEAIEAVIDEAKAHQVKVIEKEEAEKRHKENKL